MRIGLVVLLALVGLGTASLPDAPLSASQDAAAHCHPSVQCQAICIRYPGGWPPRELCLS